jgi:hypothetical protein
MYQYIEAGSCSTSASNPDSMLLEYRGLGASERDVLASLWACAVDLR